MRGGRLQQRNPGFFGAQEREHKQGVQARATKVLNGFKRLQERGTLCWSSMNLDAVPPELFTYLTGDLQIEGLNWWQEETIKKIDLSNNILTEIDARLEECVDLEDLNISSNQLTTVSPCISTLPVLKKLDLQHNNIKDIPCDIQNCPILVDLNLSDNQLTVLPNLPVSLLALKCDRNQLKALPKFCGKLEVLSANENMIQRVDIDSISQSIRSISITNNVLTYFECKSSTPSLTNLDLHTNKLTSTFILHDAPVLDTLSLSNNTITDIQGLEKAKKLSVLLLNSNKMRALPSGVPTLNCLNTLAVANNDLSSLPDALGHMDSLKRMQLEGNAIRSIRQHVLTGTTENLKNYLRSRSADVPIAAPQASDPEVKPAARVAAVGGVLDLRQVPNVDSSTVASVVDSLPLPGVSKAELADLQLTDFPDIRGEKWHNVTHIRAAKNHFQVLPLSFRLPFLQELDLKNNRLKCLPNDVDSPMLTHIDISANALTNIPVGWVKGKSLQEIRFCYNKISNLDIFTDEFVSKELRVVDASNNAITFSPAFEKFVDTLPNVHTLLLENNDISRLPPLWGTWECLRTLTLVGNPLRRPNPSVVARGCDAIKSQLKNLL